MFQFLSRENELQEEREEEVRKRGWYIEGEGGGRGGRITGGFIFGRGLGRRLKSRCTPACRKFSARVHRDARTRDDSSRSVRTL